jgi:hypothetical protein
MAEHLGLCSVSFTYEGANIEGNWFVIADALRQAGLDLSGVAWSGCDRRALVGRESLRSVP